MSLAVLKFGGTSVSTKENREYVYERIIEYKKKFDDIVVVVSAQGREGEPYATDTLIKLLENENKEYGLREKDAIFACGEIISASVIASGLEAKNLSAISLTGRQAGIWTDSNYGDADIIDIESSNLTRHLKENKIAVVAGAQGMSINGDITTLGRGGSDTTAAALGVHLNADETVIYTDVEGIMTADPRYIKNVKLFEGVDFDFCYSYANCGAKVIHGKAVRIAKEAGYDNLYIKSTFTDKSGTRIWSGTNNIFGIAYNNNHKKGAIVYNRSNELIRSKAIVALSNDMYVNINEDNNIISFEIKSQNPQTELQSIHDLLLKAI
jgi:aspartate kinase